MIKLTDLINELDKPENMYTPGYNPEKEDKEFLKKGYRMAGTTIDPETGKSTSNVEYLADFNTISGNLSEIIKQVRPLKSLTGNDNLTKSIKNNSTELTKRLSEARRLANVLSGLIELYK